MNFSFPTSKLAISKSRSVSLYLLFVGPMAEKWEPPKTHACSRERKCVHLTRRLRREVPSGPHSLVAQCHL